MLQSYRNLVHADFFTCMHVWSLSGFLCVVGNVPGDLLLKSMTVAGLALSSSSAKNQHYYLHTHDVRLLVPSGLSSLSEVSSSSSVVRNCKRTLLWVRLLLLLSPLLLVDVNEYSVVE